MSLRLSRIRRYPVKSCRGEDLDAAVVEPWGLAGDRRWMVVDPTRTVVTARTVPALLRVRPEVTDGGLVLRAPDADPLTVPAPAGPLVEVVIHRSRLPAADAGDAAAEWFTARVGRPLRLIYLDDPTRRPTNPERTRPGDRVSFADGYPLLLITAESLAALDDHVAAGPNPDAAPLALPRFRPNLVVTGAPAWAEDGWRGVRVGGVAFRVVKGCDRCVLTTFDPDTGEKGREPLFTLARHRRWDGGVWFGINLVPDLSDPSRPDVGIEVGAPVEILDATDPDCPLR